MELQVQKRNTDTKPKNLRKEGIIPAEVYGKDFENEHVAVKEKDFNTVFEQAGMSQIVDLQIEGKEVPVLIYDVQYHPISRKPLAIDFYKISKDEKLTTTVPLKFIGEAPIEKEGFTAVKILNEVEIKAFPDEIPQEIEVDLTELEEESDMIHIQDLETKEEIEIMGDPDTVIVSVSEKREEEEEEELETIMPGELGELETEEESPLEEGSEEEEVAEMEDEEMTE
ncbi:MAG: 50S ribosomal protein L25 [Candidatus Magasanikbacteria bacterium]